MSDHQKLIDQIERDKKALLDLIAKRDAGKADVEKDVVADLEEVAIDMDALAMAARSMSDRLTALAHRVRSAT